jgi:pimeloyl-ACP methyl ester carboxylesterase
MQIIVDSLLTHFERAGHGHAVLILPGWADTSKSWTAVQKKLSEKYDVIVLDLPGFGGSQRSDESWNLDNYAEFISHFLSKLGTPELYAVIGHSNGGAMAIRALSSSQIHASKLILLASAGIRADRESQKKILKAVARTGKILSAPLPGSVRQKLRARLYSSIGSDMLVAEHMQETFKQIVQDDVQADATKLHLPTLLIYGDKDTETPIRYAEILHRLIKKSKLTVMPDADHFLHLNRADDVSNNVLEFLR